MKGDAHEEVAETRRIEPFPASCVPDCAPERTWPEPAGYLPPRFQPGDEVTVWCPGEGKRRSGLVTSAPANGLIGLYQVSLTETCTLRVHENAIGPR
jgi:hypothetical protein